MHQFCYSDLELAKKTNTPDQDTFPVLKQSVHFTCS